MQRVKGHSSYYRNEVGAIINMDSDAYNKSKKKKLAEEARAKRLEYMEEEISETKQELREIKELLKQFLNK